MFGWEFSPIVAGGLGVVCKALSTSLVENYNTSITYVLPTIPEGVVIDSGNIEFKNAAIENIQNPYLKVIGVNSNITSPYFSPLVSQEFKFNLKNAPVQKKSGHKDIYGQNLIQEVEEYANKASAFVKTNDYDIIHNHDWMTASAAIKAKELSGKPMVMHVHATEHERTLGKPHPYIFAQELKGMITADVIIAVSEITKQRIVENYGIEPSKIIIVHNAIERLESKYGPIAKSVYKDDQIVLFLARLTAMKGADHLLKAAQKVIKVLPKTKFLFIGHGELLEELIEMSVELGISHKVTFTGFLPHDQVDRVYRFANVFVMPSVMEPFGITPLEAIKNGTPVIISKQSGVSEVLQNVLKVDFWDVNELANKLIAVLKYGVLAEELSNNSKHDLEKLTWDSQSKKVLNIYEQLKSNYNLNVEKA